MTTPLHQPATNGRTVTDEEIATMTATMTSATMGRAAALLRYANLTPTQRDTLRSAIARRMEPST